VKANPDWVTELQIMVTTKVKAEIQALSSFGARQPTLTTVGFVRGRWRAVLAVVWQCMCCKSGGGAGSA